MVNWRNFLSMPIWQKGKLYLDQRVLKWVILIIALLCDLMMIEITSGISVTSFGV